MAGATITESMVDRSEVPSSVAFVDGLVTFDELSPATVATRTLQAGEAIPRSAIGGREQTSGARVMAIPVESWQAAGGELDVGDQVDVIDTGEGGPRYVLSGAAVVGRSVEDNTGGLGGVVVERAVDLGRGQLRRGARAVRGHRRRRVRTGPFDRR